jgi:hypothetical protein
MASAMAASAATPLTLACLTFRLRSPRPPRHRLWLQPGTAAMVVCSLLFVVKGVEVAGAFAKRYVNARAIGSKGYHAGAFRDGPYPVE